MNNDTAYFLFNKYPFDLIDNTMQLFTLERSNNYVIPNLILFQANRAIIKFLGDHLYFCPQKNSSNIYNVYTLKKRRNTFIQ